MSNRFPLVNHGGYDPEIVDSTMEKLEEVLRSYKEKDASIKNAILSAQIAADQIIANAKIEAENQEAFLEGQLQTFLRFVEVYRKKINDFQSSYENLIKTYLLDIKKEDFAELQEKLNSIHSSVSAYGRKEDMVQEPVTDKKEDISSSHAKKTNDPIEAVKKREESMTTNRQGQHNQSKPQEPSLQHTSQSRMNKPVQAPSSEKNMNTPPPLASQAESSNKSASINIDDGIQQTMDYFEAFQLDFPDDPPSANSTPPSKPSK